MIMVLVMRMCSLFISNPVKNVSRDFHKYLSCIHYIHSFIQSSQYSRQHQGSEDNEVKEINRSNYSAKQRDQLLKKRRLPECEKREFLAKVLAKYRGARI